MVEGIPPPLLDDPVLGGERLRGGELRPAELVAAAVRVVVVGLGVGERLVRVQGRHDVLPAAAAVAAEGRLGLLRDGGDVGAWTRQSKWGGLFERWRASAPVPIIDIHAQTEPMDGPR